MQPIIRVENLSKQYRIGRRQPDRTLRETMSEMASAPFRRLGSVLRPLNGRNGNDDDTIWALKDVSFEVMPGEVVGIIGRNGAGKSTLLKILSRITDPTSGGVDLHGRVGSLLEVGTGFHPELTGRENIYLNGAILGMRRAEIERKFDEIVAFAEIERFLDTPVKHYSSGMYVRLAFAVAAHLEPEILLVDEVLAVGDAAFQSKCLGKMGDVAKEGRTVLFVSHNMLAVVSLCTRVIFLETGGAFADGGASEVVEQYLRNLESISTLPLDSREDRKGDRSLRFLGVDLRDKNGWPITRAYSGQDVTLAIKYKTLTGSHLKNVHVAIPLHGRFGENLFHLSTSVNGFEFDSIPADGEILCTIPQLPLQPGRYSYNLFCTVGGEIADWVQNAGLVEVEPGDFFDSGKLPPATHGSFMVRHSWHLKDHS